jgi:hypothetical protein
MGTPVFRTRRRPSFGPLASLAVAFVLFACSEDEREPDVPNGTGGSSATGGRAGGGGVPAAGAGGTPSSGGSAGRASGGSAGRASGGSAGRASGGGAGRASGGSASGGQPGSAGSAGDEPGKSDAGAAGSSGAPEPCGAISTFEAGATPERELFVDAEASGPGDGSPAEPFPTLDAALSAVTPGTAIRLRPGTYAGGTFASDLAGTASAPIWIGGVPGSARPVISGGATALQLSRVSYLVVHDLEVTGQSANGLNIDDGGDYDSEVTHHLVFRNLSIRDLGNGGNQDCLKLSGVYDYVVLDSEFEGCSGGSAIDQVGCHRGLLAHNSFLDLGGNGVQTKGGSDRIEITRNRFVNAGERAVNMGGSTDFEFFRPPLSTTLDNYEASEIRVVANLFRGSVSPIAFVGCVNCLLANNTVIDPSNWVLRILQETTSVDGSYSFLPAQNGRVTNNVFYFSRAELSTFVNVGPDTSPDSFEFTNNLWYAHDDPDASEPSPLPAAEVDGIYGENPGFADAAGADYAITAASPAAGAGVAAPGTPSADLAGRCYADPPSLGAYEAP